MKWKWMMVVLWVGAAVACQNAPVDEMGASTSAATLVAEATTQIEATATKKPTETMTSTLTPTVTATQVPPSQTPELVSLPSATSTMMPSATPIVLGHVTHQLVMSNGKLIVWLGEDREPWLLESDIRKGYLDLSPDGRSLVYVTNANDWGSHMVIESLDGVEPIEIEFVYDELILSPDWSPDGKQLVFSADLQTSGQNPDLYIVALDNLSEPFPLFMTGSFDLDPVWSPDGRQIAFASDSEDYGNYDIFVINADGTDLHQITFLEGDAREPVWSPDGQYLSFLYSDDIDEFTRLAILSTEQFGDPEQQPLLIHHPDGDVRSPVWSADGKLVGFLVGSWIFVADLLGNVDFGAFEPFDVWHMDWQFSFVEPVADE